MHISYNVEVVPLAIFLVSALLVLRDRVNLIAKHDETIEKLSAKLTEVSEALIKLAAEFHTYREEVQERKPRAANTRHTR